jgi:hydrogenase maturation protease
MTGLIVGLGNVDRGDDAVGVDVARRALALSPAGVDVVATDDPASLLDLWAGVDDVVVVDGMVSHREPGTVVRVDVGASGLPSHGWSAGGSHALGLGAAVELSRALGRLPARLVLVGVEVGSTVPGAEMSAAVSAAVDSAARTALAVLEEGGR